MESGPFFQDASEIADLVVGVHDGIPVHLRDVARVAEGPEEATTYTRIGLTTTGGASVNTSSPTTVIIAKRSEKRSSFTFSSAVAP